MSCIFCRSSISSLHDEAARATKKLTEAGKLLRKVREDLNLQITNLINLTSLLQRGDEDLQNDFVTIRRHELNSQLVREAIIAGAGSYSINKSIERTRRTESLYIPSAYKMRSFQVSGFTDCLFLLPADINQNAGYDLWLLFFTNICIS